MELLIIKILCAISCISSIACLFIAVRYRINKGKEK